MYTEVRWNPRILDVGRHIQTLEREVHHSLELALVVLVVVLEAFEVEHQYVGSDVDLHRFHGLSVCV